jgi:hypothetical protein
VLTTNRVTTFDRAFKSRIHLSLRYEDLSCAARENIWHAFLEKTRTDGVVLHGEITPNELKMLSERNMNGRQIRNAMKLAVALANYKKEAFGYKHLVQTIDLMEDSGLQD